MPRDAKLTLPQRCARIELLVLDVDGVLSDGRIFYSDRGEEMKSFYVRDGSGMKLWTNAGKKASIITGRSSPIVQRRAEEIGITKVILGAVDKHAALMRLLADLNVAAEHACAIGDDVVDLGMMSACGLAVTVADACADAIAAADYVTHAAGGRGAVREVIELLMRAQGSWSGVLARYQGGAHEASG